MAKTYGQSTKESYRDDIETSRKSKTIYKNYEYYDDYSYGNSDKIGHYIEKNDGDDGDSEIYLYLFQEDGPKDEETLKKFLEWRKSGKSNEIGHKGGGNKRNIYGFNCSEAFICTKIDDKKIIRCSTKPDSLYELSISDIDEETFRSQCDSSSYITNPEKLKIRNVPSWYKDTYDKIKTESGISPNFLIRLELSEIPSEYNNKDKWTEYINQVRAKQYKIPIYFKNELLLMNEYEKYENIDLVGFHDPNKIDEKKIKLYINKETFIFYILHDDSYIDVITNKKVDYNENIIEWGGINMFIVSSEYFTTQLKEFNNNNNNRMRAEDFYGIYLLLNGKLTNYLPFEGKLLGDSKCNHVLKLEGGKTKSCGRFRLILKPGINNCKNEGIFDALIQTREIKALTNFLDKSPHKEIKDIAMKIYRDEPLIKPPPTKKNKIKVEKTKDGGVYIVYLGNGLWKFGMVVDHDNKSKRISDHKSTRIEKITEYINYLKNKALPKGNKCIEVYYKKTPSPKGCEEMICKTLQDKNKIKLFQCEKSSNGIREYFVCDDFDYIHDNICNDCDIILNNLI